MLSNIVVENVYYRNCGCIGELKIVEELVTSKFAEQMTAAGIQD